MITGLILIEILSIDPDPVGLILIQKAYFT